MERALSRLRLGRQRFERLSQGWWTEHRPPISDDRSHELKAPVGARSSVFQICFETPSSASGCGASAFCKVHQSQINLCKVHRSLIKSTQCRSERVDLPLVRSGRHSTLDLLVSILDDAR